MPNPELQALILNCLYALDKLSLPEKLVKAVFELRCACLAGYMPSITGCYRCQNPTPDRFNIAEGRLECSACRTIDSDGLRMPVTPGVLDAMRYICYCDPKRLFGFQAEEGTVDGLSQLAEAYLATQLERGFSTLDFYKTLLLQ
jgi:DNA repair protein RecO (recombination protein O)